VDPTVQVALIGLVQYLVGTLFWLLLIVLVFRTFKERIGGLVGRITDFSLKAPGGEIAVKVAAETGAALTAAESARASEEGGASDDADVVAIQHSASVAARVAPTLRNRRILWVDDSPGNNKFEIAAFEAAGLQVETSTSTEDAMTRLHARSYDLIITDLTRGRDTEAGLKFIAKVRDVFPHALIVVYSSKRGVPQYPRAYEAGAVGATYKPHELFDRVIAFLKGSGNA
jgi:CheY-like chemotaxis protein